jgi:ubiquinone/menaquinone biosynthesis C-methylase UbiE
MINNDYIKALRSPITGEQLYLSDKCLKDLSGNEFPIINGIPRFVDSSNYAINFGFQWNEFSEVQIDSVNKFEISKKRFYETLNIKQHELRGLRVLEVGSGAGRFTEYLLNEECHLYSIDYSNAVEANLKINGKKFFLAQADIYKLPFQLDYFDIVICLGVIQHTPNVEKSFDELVRLIKPGGRLVIDVYAKNWKTIFNTRFWFRPITKRLKAPLLLNIIKWYVPIWFPISSLFLRVPYFGKFLAQLLPISNYTLQYPFMAKQDLLAWAILDTFDMLSPKYDNPQSIKKLQYYASKNHLFIEYLGKGQNGYVLRVVKK